MCLIYLHRSNMRTHLLRPEEVLQHWPFLGHHIEKSLKHSAGESTSYDWFKRTQNYEAFIIVVNNDQNQTVNVTLFQFINHAQHKSLHIVATASTEVGTWADYKEAHHTLEDIARQNDCKRIEMWGRKGWTRALDKLTGLRGEKYKQRYVVMDMILEE